MYFCNYFRKSCITSKFENRLIYIIHQAIWKLMYQFNQLLNYFQINSNSINSSRTWFYSILHIYKTYFNSNMDLICILLSECNQLFRRLKHISPCIVPTNYSLEALTSMQVIRGSFFLEKKFFFTILHVCVIFFTELEGTKIKFRSIFNFFLHYFVKWENAKELR
jgi:hypothetical protein